MPTKGLTRHGFVFVIYTEAKENPRGRSPWGFKGDCLSLSETAVEAEVECNWFIAFFFGE